MYLPPTLPPSWISLTSYVLNESRDSYRLNALALPCPWFSALPFILFFLLKMDMSKIFVLLCLHFLSFYITLGVL